MSLRRYDQSLFKKSKKLDMCYFTALSYEEREILLDRIEKELRPISQRGDCKAKDVVVFGLNVVTRLLERRLLTVVILSKEAMSGPLIQHILILAQVYKVPVCILPEARGKLGSIFGLRSICAFGIKKWDQDTRISEDLKSSLANIQDFIISKCNFPKHRILEVQETTKIK